MDEVEDALSRMAQTKNENFLSRYWNGLNKKSKIGMIFAVLLILAVVLWIIPGLLYPTSASSLDNKASISSTPLTINQSTNASSIEVRIISSGNWTGSSEIYYLDNIESLGGAIQMDGTGNKTFKVSGNPVKIAIKVWKTNIYDESMLSVQLIVNGTVVEQESMTGNYPDKLILKHDFSS